MKKLYLPKAMRRIVLIGVAVMCTSNVAAQQPSSSRGYIAGFVQNRFSDNWELSAGGGVSCNYSGSTDVGWASYIAATKWLHPVFGLRLNVGVGQYGNDGHDWTYVGGDANLMVNFSNWVSGYREDRAYYAIPFAGFGYYGNVSYKHTDNDEHFIGVVGLLNRFRVGRALDIDIQMACQTTKASYNEYATRKGSHFYGFLTTAGITYRFNQRTFDMCGATEAQAMAAMERIKKLQAQAQAANDAAALAAQAQARAEQYAAAARREAASAKASYTASQQNATVVTEPQSARQAIEEGTAAGYLFYDINSAALSQLNRQRLNVVKDYIDASPREKFHIDGFADAGTGTPPYNKQLSERRAENVYDYLVKAGVPASRLTYKGYGSTDTPFARGASNRAVVIY